MAFNWCITLNNYTEEEYQDILRINVGKQVGAEGTLHERQKTKRKLSFMKKKLRQWQLKAVKKTRRTRRQKNPICSRQRRKHGKNLLSQLVRRSKTSKSPIKHDQCRCKIPNGKRRPVCSF